MLSSALKPALRYQPAAVPIYALLNPQGQPYPEAQIFFLDTYTRTDSAKTLRTYAYALLDWYQFLERSEVKVHEVRRTHVTSYIAHLKTKVNPQRRVNAKKTGTQANPVTGKHDFAQGYSDATINLRLTVVALFFDVLQQTDYGPEHHPMRRVSRQTFAQTSGLHASVRQSVRIRQPQRLAHALPRPLLDQFRDLAVCDRDRALIEGLYSSAARISEMLALTVGDVRWEEQQIMLQTKGRKGVWPVVVSLRFLELLRVYLASRDDQHDPAAHLWLMRRGESRALTYSAFRAVLRRLNEQLGSNVTAHDFRTTSATHLAENPRVPFLAIQNHMRHRHAGTTYRYVSAARPSSLLILRDHFARSSDPVILAPEYDREMFARVVRRPVRKQK